MSETPKPEVGQIWADWDNRSRHEYPRKKRLLKIVAINMDKTLTAEVIHNDLSVSKRTGYTTTIRLSRMKPTTAGYKYIEG